MDRKSFLPVGVAEERIGRPLGVRHHPEDIPRLVDDPGDIRQRSVGIRLRGDVARRRRSTGRRPVPPPSSRRSVSAIGEVVPFAVRDREWRSTSPGGTAPVNRVPAFSTRRWTYLQTNRSEAFRSSTPGRSPASSRIWNPLQMPITGPPAGSEPDDFLHHRREPRDGAAAEVVAVREPSRQNDDVRRPADPPPCARGTPPPGRGSVLQA